MKFKNKVVLITGASSGIGKAFALRVAREGAVVILAARSAERLNQVAAEVNRLGGRALVVPTDVTDAAQVKQLFLQAVADGRRLHLVLNNAGLGYVAPLAELTDEQITRMVDVNFLGMAYVAKYAAEVFARQQFGHLIFTSSLAGLVTIPQWSVYSGTKWGVTALADTLRSELEEGGALVTTIHPSAVQTDFFAKGKADIDIELMGGGGALKASDVADAIYAAAFTRTRRVKLPRTAAIYALLYKYFPILLEWVMQRYARLNYHKYKIIEDNPEFDRAVRS